MPMPAALSRNLRAPSVIAGALLLATNVGAAEHTLMPTPQTVHIGYFLASLKPVLTIDSGDIVTLEGVAAIVPDVVDKAGVVPPSAVPQYQRDIYGQVKDRGPGPHVLTGPIEIKGAEPGDVLEVRILDISLALDWGYNRQRAYAGALPDEFTAQWNRIIPINRQAKTAEVAKGVVVPVDKPFFGTMGLAPDPTMGRISSGPPGVHTGNLDNKDLIAGTTLFMPVHAPGAMFSAGDAHAAQGHGEVDLTAIETGAARQIPVHRAQGPQTRVAARRDAHALDRDGFASEPGRGDEDRGARDHRFHHQALPQPDARRGLHDRQRGRGLPRHPGRGRHQGHPRHDPEIDFCRAAVVPLQPVDTLRRIAQHCALLGGGETRDQRGRAVPAFLVARAEQDYRPVARRHDAMGAEQVEHVV
jgi:acetamidase/formamidase